MSGEAAGPQREALARVLRTYDGLVVARGRAYADEGRVTGLRQRADAAHAVVLGTQRYDVSLALVEDDDGLLTECSCPGYARDEQCKHIAAVAWALTRGGTKPPRRTAEALPGIFRSVYATGEFLSRLSLHAGELLEVRVERWYPLADWWKRASADRSPLSAAACARVRAHAAEIAADVQTLREWTPPETPLPGTAFGDLYAKLAERYLARRPGAKVRRAAPGPLSGPRHPGFLFSYDPKRRVFEARERPSPLLPQPLRLTVTVPLDPSEPLRIENDPLHDHGSADAWDLFALRALLLAFSARDDDPVRALAADLGKPLWERLLDGLAVRGPKVDEPREWAFCLSPAYHHAWDLFPYARSAREGSKPGKWRKQTFEALFDDPCSPLEGEIARAAASRIERVNQARVELATPQGHSLLRLLASHPRTRISLSGRPDPEGDPRAEILVGRVTMRLERAPNGTLAPRFLVGDKELSASMLTRSSGAFRAASRGTTLVSAFIPPALRPWLDMVDRMGPAFAFPPEAVAKIAAATEPLVSAGVAVLPKEALGAELAYEPRAGLRVDWRVDGAAVVEVLIAAHPRAPLVPPGEGPELLTFEDAGRRVFVERALDTEMAIAEAACAAIEAPILWERGRGRTESLEEALALADYLDRNPLGLVIEVKVGRAPTVVQWSAASRALRVSREGDWLVLDGDIDGAGVKLTIGDVLEAARLARRFVKAGDGVFLELSKEAIARLQPVAMATELGASAVEDEAGVARLHHAFGGVLAEAGSLFESVHGADLREYARRFEARGKAAVRPKLDKGRLRSYQREGAEWMLSLATWAPGCVLADDMGLGKTVQTAAVLKARAALGPALVVAPASVSSNWVAELARFVPSLRVRWYNEDRETSPAELGAGDVLVVSYGLLQRRSGAFCEPRWATLVIDEAQYIKNVGAQRTDAIRGLSRDFTIALTGTPLENHLGELFSIVDVAFPGLLGDEGVFRERFRRPIEGRGDGARLEALGRMLAPFLLRRTRAQVLRELPPREEITEHIELGLEERKRYLALRRACEEQFKKRQRGETPAQLKIALLAALTRLRQLACDVRLVDPSFEGGSAKITRAVQLATELAAEGNRALVFSQFTQFLDKVRVALEEAGLRVAYLAGDTPTAKRRAIVDAFQAGEYDIFCVSLLAGGTGLNLTKASYVIHLDPWWNPAAEEQATSRSHRMGQTTPVTVYRLVSRGTIEEAVLDMQRDKKELAAAVLEGKAGAKAVSPAELLDLLRFGA